jgi:hypothetical protein
MDNKQRVEVTVRAAQTVHSCVEYIAVAATFTRAVSDGREELKGFCRGNRAGCQHGLDFRF